ASARYRALRTPATDEQTFSISSRGSSAVGSHLLTRTHTHAHTHTHTHTHTRQLIKHIGQTPCRAPAQKIQHGTYTDVHLCNFSRQKPQPLCMHPRFVFKHLTHSDCCGVDLISLTRLNDAA